MIPLIFTEGSRVFHYSLRTSAISAGTISLRRSLQILGIPFLKILPLNHRFYHFPQLAGLLMM